MSSDPRFQGFETTQANPDAVRAIERIAVEGSDNDLTRINPLAFARQHQLDEQDAIGAFLHASRLGLFDLTWTVHCPKCAGTLVAVASPKSIQGEPYYCTLCDVHLDATLDRIVEACFTVNQRIRTVPAHAPETVSAKDYLSGLHFSTRLPVEVVTNEFLAKCSLYYGEVPPGGQVVVDLDPGPGRFAMFEPITHATAMFEVDPAAEGAASEATVTFTGISVRMPPTRLKSGKVSVRIENRSTDRILPLIHRFNAAVGKMFQIRQPYLSAKRLFTHPVFRELFRTSALDIDQKLKVESLTILFTDLKGSTELYERVGDLSAFDLVRRHFGVLEEAVRSHHGSVVKTIGDAVMAAFPTPDQGLQAALQMRAALADFNRKREHEDLLVKIGLHDGPCLAVMLNERLDYFGQTVNIAARVQGLAEAQAILLTTSVLRSEGVPNLIESRGLKPAERHASLKGIKGDVTLYELAA